MKNNFEQIIKDSLENHEVPYEAGAWEKFNQAQTPAPFYKSKWFFGGAALIAIITAITLYNLDFGISEAKVIEDNNQIAELSKAEHSVEKTILKVNNETVETKINLGKTEFIVENPIPKTDKDDVNKVTNLLSTIYPDDNHETNTLVQDGEVNTLIRTEEKKKDSTLKVEPNTPVVNLTPPSASFFIEKTICEGNNITLIADNVNDNYDYSWKLNDEEIVSGKLVSLEATLIGENKVTLFIGKDGLQIAEKKSSFTVIETPRNNVNIELNQASLVNELEFDLDDASKQIVWNFGDGNTSSENKVNHTYKKAGKYKCEYTITAINGCSASFNRNINVKGYYNLRTDYGFSPGKRDNLNDVFIPVELKDLNVPFELSIYARNGQLIYTTTTLDKPWDGRMKDGSTCPFGSYIWSLSLTNELGIEEGYKGTVTNINN